MHKDVNGCDFEFYSLRFRQKNKANDGRRRYHIGTIQMELVLQIWIRELLTKPLLLWYSEWSECILLLLVRKALESFEMSKWSRFMNFMPWNFSNWNYFGSLSLPNISFFQFTAYEWLLTMCIESNTFQIHIFNFQRDPFEWIISVFFFLE